MAQIISRYTFELKDWHPLFAEWDRKTREAGKAKFAGRLRNLEALKSAVKSGLDAAVTEIHHHADSLESVAGLQKCRVESRNKTWTTDFVSIIDPTLRSKDEEAFGVLRMFGLYGITRQFRNYLRGVFAQEFVLKGNVRIEPRIEYEYAKEIFSRFMKACVVASCEETLVEEKSETRFAPPQPLEDAVLARSLDPALSERSLYW